MAKSGEVFGTKPKRAALEESVSLGQSQKEEGWQALQGLPFGVVGRGALPLKHCLTVLVSTICARRSTGVTAEPYYSSQP